MRRPEETASILSDEDISFAFELFVNRLPTSEELAQIRPTAVSIKRLSNQFLRSQEFGRRWEKHRATLASNFPPALVLLHIPKAAGTSVRSILEKSFGYVDTLALDPAAVPDFANRPTVERRKLRFIHGHLVYGLDAFLPQGCIYITVLRRPEERLFSFFKYLLRTPENRMYPILKSAAMSFGDFLEYANSDMGLFVEVNNGQVRRLSGRMSGGGIGQEHAVFQSAVKNAFASNMIVGLSENLDLFLQDLFNRKLISSIKNEYINVAPKSQSFNDAILELTVGQAALLAEYTHWDNLLYSMCESYILGEN